MCFFSDLSQFCMPSHEKGDQGCTFACKLNEEKIAYNYSREIL